MGWVHASMDIGKCGYLGCSFGLFGSLNRPQMADFECQDTDRVGGIDRGFR